MTEEVREKSTLEVLLETFKPSGFYSSSGKTTTHKTKSDVNQRQIIWAVRTLSSGTIELNPLFNGLPAPASMKLAKKISREKFIENYWPEPESYCQDAQKKFAAQKELTGYPTTLKETIKAYLPMMLVFLASGQREKAETVVDFLVEHNVPMCDRQKKILNRVAVELRKTGNYEAAMGVYASVEKYYGEDEHLHFNIARTLWDMKQLDKCEEHLERSIRINPYLEVTQKFLKQLRKFKNKKSKATAVKNTFVA